MMNGPEKSDSAIVAKKPANKAGVPVAERVERRAGTKGNAGQPRMHRTQCRGRVSLRVDRVRTATLPSNTRGRSRMLELGTFGNVELYITELMGSIWLWGVRHLASYSCGARCGIRG